MMPFITTSNHTTVIRQDRHGLFFRTNGALFRPQRARGCPVHRLAVDESYYRQDSKVRVKHVAHTTFGAIQGYRGRIEFWYAHGTSDNKSDTEEIWNPS